MITSGKGMEIIQELNKKIIGSIPNEIHELYLREQEKQSKITILMVE